MGTHCSIHPPLTGVCQQLRRFSVRVTLFDLQVRSAVLPGAGSEGSEPSRRRCPFLGYRASFFFSHSHQTRNLARSH